MPRSQRAHQVGTARAKVKAPESLEASGPRLKVAPVILTIGHSTRSLEEFIALLTTHRVTRVVDVRTFPRSRYNPQFNKPSLPKSLEKVGIGYVHLPGLGGLRHASPDSINLGWRNASFRGYADYMQTQDFENNLQELIRLAEVDRIALMCAEAVPWRCHRSLIADALLAHRIRTLHIMSPARLDVHTLTPFARINGTKVSYPSEDQANQLKLFSVETKRATRPEAG
jgi:uncharacterized protein (DUF488 family)